MEWLFLYSHGRAQSETGCLLPPFSLPFFFFLVVAASHNLYPLSTRSRQPIVRYQAARKATFLYSVGVDGYEMTYAVMSCTSRGVRMTLVNILFINFFDTLHPHHLLSSSQKIITSKASPIVKIAMRDFFNCTWTSSSTLLQLARAQ